ncbi:MAG TPA: ROK family transcriptional regulator [Solirubrobacteraceae bacterium]|jgi:predicted NBD/HSP70 family sugar kinase
MPAEDSTGALDPARRSPNLLRIVEALRAHGTVSRAEIARETGLSRSTVSTLVAELMEAGLVVERGERGGGGAGRPPVMIALDSSAGVAIGIDFAHMSVRVAIADLASRVLGETERELDVDHGAIEALDAAAEIVDELLGEAGVERERVLGAGMGLAGPIDHARGRVHPSAILPSWVGVEAQAEMEARLGVPVRLENDANLGALAEAAFGAGRGAATFIYLMMSGGIGAGMFLGGRLFRGATGMAGELGHTFVEDNGPLCRCGNRGCLETLVAGPALAELVSRSRGEVVSIPEMVQLALDGDVGARRVIADAGRVTGRAVAALCNQLNPERIIVGGHLGLAGDILLDPLRESVGRYAIPAAADAVEVCRGVLDDRAEVLGALALVINQADPIFSLPFATPPVGAGAP